ncbi:MAG: hypothetical protein V5B40_22140 [Candidatus Accumulibacter meliphilus]|jgi:hypothetical protein|uniref:Contractile injection system tube protein N-terminal domain-containing protein n=1 Tax=Candidatus Accumulibacter meliphilus TaxID=2211374 RepID=A0A369XSF9_9PROT|nr:MAG: hypothetical protein DVS81_03835 [Candidatus Accumulibacter meliphilus]
MSELPNEVTNAAARFEAMTGPHREPITVHFNPASLQHTVSNTLKEEGQGAKKKQYVSQTTAKLTMDVVFDSTDTGEDVRITTNKMAQLLQPIPEGQSKKVPPVVKFSWGAYAFTGMVEQYKETIDFFAAGGLPLRSSINLTLSSQDVTFEGGTGDKPAKVDTELAPEPVVVPDDEGPLGGAQGAANKAGDPRAARGIAAANGAASLRFGAGGGLAVGASASVGFSAGAAVGAGFSAGVGASAGGGFSASASAAGSVGGSANLLPAAAFAAGGGAGLSVGGGAGLGVSAGGGVGAGAGLSLGGGASASLSLGAGASASAGFSGLRVESKLSSRPLSTGNLLQSSASISSAGKVAVGGRLIDGGGSGLKADVSGDAEFVIGSR